VPLEQVRRLACLILGSAIVIDALSADRPVGELIVGCIVLGVLPLDFLGALARIRHGSDP
jgi:hypothetical protein